MICMTILNIEEELDKNTCHSFFSERLTAKNQSEDSLKLLVTSTGYKVQEETEVKVKETHIKYIKVSQKSSDQ